MNTLSFVVHSLPPIMRRKHLFRTFIAVSIVAGFMFISAVGAGAEEEQLPDRFGLRLGGYNIRNASNIMRLDSTNGLIGTYIDFEKTLGGDTTATVFRIDGFYRFNDHHSLSFSWYDIHLTGSRVLIQEFVWGGNTYTIGTQVDSELRFDVAKLSYQYSVYHNDKVELGASIGLHVDHRTTGISASGISDAGSQTITAPLLGLFANYNFTPSFSVYYNYQFFFFSYEDKFTGGLQDFLLGLEYRLFRNVGLGAAFNRFGADLKLVGNDKTLYIDTNWNGGMLYAAVYF